MSARRSPRSTSSASKEFERTPSEGLKEVGLAESRIFDRAVLERAEQELKRQYLSAGPLRRPDHHHRHALERNRVGVNFNVVEGEAAKIRQISVIGNKVFREGSWSTCSP